MICKAYGVCATEEIARDKKHFSGEQNQAIFPLTSGNIAK
jgi:hypothetical protein